MSLFDSLTGAPAKEATAQNMLRLRKLEGKGLDYLDEGKTGALGSLDAAAGVYQPLQQKYGQGTDLYLDSLGVNGAAGNANAVNSFQTGPGYEFAVNQSLDALDRRAASRGMLASGNNTLDTLGTVNGLANQEYSGWQNKLAGLISPEMQAAGGVAGANANKANVYSQDAMNRVNLSSNVANGMNSSATQGANAQMQASGNALGLGMQLANLGVNAMSGGMGGGTSMLGGGAPNSSFSWGGQQYPMYR